MTNNTTATPDNAATLANLASARESIASARRSCLSVELIVAAMRAARKEPARPARKA